MKIALVTGGSGVIGQALVPLLAEEGYKVRVLDLLAPPLYVEFIKGNILDRDIVFSAAKGCNVVFHLAAKLPQAWLSEKEFYKINVVGTVNIINACIKHGIQQLVFASTTEIYGPQRIQKPLDEDAVKLFTGIYSRNKFECEQILKKAFKEHGLETVSLRIPMVLGPGFYHEKSILFLLWLAHNNFPFPISDPSLLLSFVSSEDAAQGFLLAAKSRDAPGNVFNIAAPDYPTMGEFFKSFLNSIGSRSKLVCIPNPVILWVIKLAKFLKFKGKFFATPSELIDFIKTGGAYSIERARKVLGYNPRHTCLDAWIILYRWFFGLETTERMKFIFGKWS